MEHQRSGNKPSHILKSISTFLGATVLVAGAYTGAAKLGFLFALVNDSVTLIWPPAGIALAVMLIGGWRMLPGIVLGAFLANLSGGGAWIFPAATAMGNPAEACIGMWILTRLLHFRREMNRVGDVLGLSFIAAPICAIIAATIGVTALWDIGQVSSVQYFYAWFHWWLGDVVGIIVVTPVVVSLYAYGVPEEWSWRRILEGITFMAAASFGSFLLFNETFTAWPALSILVIPLLIFIAFRFSLREVAIANLMVAVGAVIGAGSTFSGYQPETLLHELLTLTALLIVMGLTTQLLAVLIGIRRRTEKALCESERNYRALVENANCIILRWDAEGKITFLNEFGQYFFGYSAEEIIGCHVVGTITPPRESGGRDLQDLIKQICRDPKAYEKNINENMRRNGERVWIAWTNRVGLDDSGELTEILSIGTDVTDQKRAEEKVLRLNRALRIRSACNESIIRATDEIELLRYICDIIVGIGGYGLAWVGYAEEGKEKIVRPVAWRSTRPGYIENIRVTWDATPSGYGPTGTAIRTRSSVLIRDIRSDPTFSPWRRAALSYGYLSEIALPLKTVEDTLGALQIYACEVDAFDKYEEKLLMEMADDLTYGIIHLRTRKERDRVRTEMETLARFTAENPYPVLRITSAGTLLYGNRSSEPLRLHEEMQVGHAVPEEWRRWVSESFRWEKNKEVERECNDRVFLLTVVPCREFGYVNVYGCDITERKRSAEALEKMSSELHLILKNMINAFVVWESVLDEEGRYVDFKFGYFNDAYEKVSGLKLNEVQGKSVFEVWPTTEKSWVEVYGRVAITGEPDIFDMYHAPTKGWYHCNAYRPTESNARVCVIFENITEKKLAEDALELHTRRVQALLDLQMRSRAAEEEILDFALGACLRITQSEYAFIGTMDEKETVLTLHRWSDNVMDMCAEALQAKEYPICSAGLWADAVRTRKPVICNDYEEPNPGKKGLPPGHISLQRFIAVPVSDGEHIVVVVTVANKERNYTEEDVSALSTLLHTMWEIISRQRREKERDILEEQYRQAQKMEAIGQLAGGVAHDFNNLLQGIMGYSQLLMDRMDEDSEEHGFVVEITRGSERAAALTRQLLAFSRRQVLTMEDLHLDVVILNISKMIERVIGENIQLNFIAGGDVCTVHADRGQMEQVLMNLCINARDAMPEGGTLTLETETICFDDEYCAAHAWAIPGCYVLLSVTDNGCGMDVTTQAHVFEPFFTTKKPGSGTGLGLAMVYGIVRQHQGMIQLYSELEKGTTFKIYLPLVSRAPVVNETAVKAKPSGGRETILLAEDEEMVRALVIRILEKAGYTVLAASNGREALEIFYQNSETIDLVLVDMVMPELGGKGLYDALRQTHPEVPFLFSSGYSAHAISAGFLAQEGVQLVQKPYAPDVLLRKIREVLDHAPGNGEKKLRSPGMHD